METGSRAWCRSLHKHGREEDVDAIAHEGLKTVIFRAHKCGWSRYWFGADGVGDSGYRTDSPIVCFDVSFPT